MSPDMTPNVLLVVVVAALVTAGVYLLLERSLTRVIIGLVLVGNGVNVLFLIAGGAAGGAPIVGATRPEDMSDPLPQAMVLTAIVITLGMTAFLLAMAYRSWQLNRHDEVQDDLEDRRIGREHAEPVGLDPGADDEADDETGGDRAADDVAADATGERGRG